MKPISNLEGIRGGHTAREGIGPSAVTDQDGDLGMGLPPFDQGLGGASLEGGHRLMVCQVHLEGHVGHPPPARLDGQRYGPKPPGHIPGFAAVAAMHAPALGPTYGTGDGESHRFEIQYKPMPFWNDSGDAPGAGSGHRGSSDMGILHRVTPREDTNPLINSTA